ncbi:DUF2795 domain-containing protein [Gandjariella thermophila]|uniref:DUF2795 domain-containing protein n=1 Tax=Gandjariella thermophila TaxID=1931992 RepID=A0A4D4J4W1_9PSEU|nr:DUF2795 domain-containing protein [Gandjariella thermophila]GDY29017.1 hypothetical protein GTS_06500 [Gandjariella thermophila]
MANQPTPIQVQKFLSGVDYPASKEDLVRHAEQHGADRQVLDALRSIPERRYNGPNAISKEIAHSG